MKSNLKRDFPRIEEIARRAYAEGLAQGRSVALCGRKRATIWEETDAFNRLVRLAINGPNKWPIRDKNLTPLRRGRPFHSNEEKLK